MILCAVVPLFLVDQYLASSDSPFFALYLFRFLCVVDVMKPVGACSLSSNFLSDTKIAHDEGMGCGDASTSVKEVSVTPAGTWTQPAGIDIDARRRLDLGMQILGSERRGAIHR